MTAIASATVLDVRGLAVAYGKARVVDDFSLTIRPSEIIAVIGSNGAGKTSIVNTLAGLMRPVAGTVTLLDKRIDRLSAERVAQAGVRLVPERRHVFASLSVRENIEVGAFRPTGGRAHVAADIERVLELFPALRAKTSARAGTLSGGQQQMLAIARALVGRPRVLMLDEPTIGLAPLIIEELFERIVQLRADGLAVLLVEQNVRGSLGIADRGYLLERGRVVLEGAAAQLAADSRVTQSYLGS